jgi:hypothetical protein
LDGGWKICALCRHLEVVEQGREFPRIADTEYLVFRCRVLGWTTREDYLMAPVEKEIQEPRPFDCPHWEMWSEPAPVEE